MEEWRPVVGYEGWYEVSSHGRVKRVRAGKGTHVGRLLKFGRDGWGYQTVPLSKEGSWKRYRMQRLVAFAFLGVPPSPKHQAHHRDHRKTNNRPDNLQWVTGQANVLAAYREGGASRRPGAANGRAKLTSKDVKAIRSLRGTMRQVDIARRFGIAQTQVSRIQRGEEWR